MSTPSLPIDSLLTEIGHTLQQHNELILEAPPGAGKTTRVPLALLDQPWLGQQTILLLEPRRLAAKAAAQRLAEQLNEPVGKRVGYRIRLESRVSADTRIEVITEGILTRMLQEDPGLEGVGAILFDEFHERSLEADTGLALALQGRELLREGPPLKLVLMSATLDGLALGKVLPQAPVIRSEGRAYPVSIVYALPARTDTPVEQRVVSRTLQVLHDHSGSLLVFLPGQGEIRRVHQALEAALGGNDDVLIAPLYGDLALAEQQRAITPAPEGQRKIVLATAIAETSLTIEGVEVVIDSGQSRQARFDPSNGMTRLYTTRVSQASAHQRAGRAGRLGPGTCYRLWSEQQHAELPVQRTPEILQADLAPLALQLLQWGVNHPDELDWLDAPAEAAFNQALDLLHLLGAVESPASGQHRLTERGAQMAELPVHPRLAHMLICGAEQGLLALAADIAALLTERDPLQTDQADLLQRLEWLETAKSPSASRIRRLAKHYRQLLPQPTCTTALEPSDVPGYLIACAYPDRIAQQRDGQTTEYRLSQGRGVRLHATDRLSRSTWLAIAAVSSHQNQAVDRIRLAAPLNPALFEGLLTDSLSREDCVEWDSGRNRLVAEARTRVGQLVLARRPLNTLPPEQATRAIIEHVSRAGLRVFNWSEKALSLRARVQFVRQHAPEPEDWPDFAEPALMGSLGSWLTPWLNSVTRGEDLKALDLHAILLARLEWPQQQALDELAPERIKVPSGSRLRVDYSTPAPTLAVKLQEMFGCMDTPRLGFGVPLTLHLLSPARRPLQVTRDLAGFWRGSYAEVRKEMKGRYPKHPWPEDPTRAQATAATKKKAGIQDT